MGWNVSRDTITRAMEELGLSRHSARIKLPISEECRQHQLAWARFHRNWTPKDWSIVLWTDEIWVTGGRHVRAYVTRRNGKEWEPSCVIERPKKKKGWMFWGSFSAGLKKGPCLFWEKEWGTINAESYCERIVPLIDEWMRMHPWLFLQQDGALGHDAKTTLKELHA